MRPDWQWSDGTPLTAADFVFAWRRNLSPALKAPLAYKLFAVQGAEAYHKGEATADDLAIRALDEQTLEIILHQPNNYFLFLLANPIAFPQPAHAWAEFMAKPVPLAGLVSNGAFQLSKATTEMATYFTRNVHYVGWRWAIWIVAIGSWPSESRVMKQGKWIGVGRMMTRHSPTLPEKHPTHSGVMSFVVLGLPCRIAAPVSGRAPCFGDVLTDTRKC